MLLLSLFGLFIALLIVLEIIYFLTKISDSPKGTKYEDCSYYKITQNSYLKILRDKGLYGEYLIYRDLFFEESKGAKFLFNCYLPRENNETTEIDVLMIHKSGIYVFESKNYSGWIFGNEKDRMWTQTLPQGRGAHKEKFFNPIKQNELHIKWLKSIITDKNIPIYSVVVFSERCTLKKVETPNYTVIKRNEISQKLKPSISEDKEVLTEENISEIYNKLYPYTQVTEEVKVKHVENIHNRQTPKAEKEIGKQQEVETKNDKQQEVEIKTDKKQEIETKSDVSQKAEIESDISTNDETESVASNDENKVVKTEEKFICPRCGNLLVLRIAKRGENIGEKFYGCSSYPKCRYIRKIEEQDI